MYRIVSTVESLSQSFSFEIMVLNFLPPAKCACATLKWISWKWNRFLTAKCRYFFSARTQSIFLTNRSGNVWQAEVLPPFQFTPSESSLVSFTQFNPFELRGFLSHLTEFVSTQINFVWQKTSKFCLVPGQQTDRHHHIQSKIYNFWTNRLSHWTLNDWTLRCEKQITKSIKSFVGWPVHCRWRWSMWTWPIVVFREQKKDGWHVSSATGAYAKRKTQHRFHAAFFFSHPCRRRHANRKAWASTENLITNLRQKTCRYIVAMMRIVYGSIHKAVRACVCESEKKPKNCAPNVLRNLKWATSSTSLLSRNASLLLTSVNSRTFKGQIEHHKWQSTHATHT